MGIMGDTCRKSFAKPLNPDRNISVKLSHLITYGLVIIGPKAHNPRDEVWIVFNIANQLAQILGPISQLFF